MPTYEFKCPRGHLFEKFFPRVSERRRLKCPECGKMAERQISGGAGLVFKGAGFYATDYKRAGDRAEKAEKKTDGEKKAAEAKPQPKKDASSDK